jgi:hypothetical protein
MTCQLYKQKFYYNEIDKLYTICFAKIQMIILYSEWNERKEQMFNLLKLFQEW